MKFKVGQIIFFKNNTLFGNAIGLFNRLNYGDNKTTHVGIITDTKEGEVQIHEALGKGFTCSWYTNEFIERGLESGKIHIGEPIVELEYVLEHANNFLGRPYAWFDIISIALTFLFKFKALKLTGANAIICSEAVARILYDASRKKIDIAEEVEKPYDLVSPMDIFKSKYITILKIQ